MKNSSEKYIPSKEQLLKAKLKIAKEDKSYWEMMIDGIVRPPRAKYNESQLGSKVISYKNKLLMKDDYEVIHQKKKIDLTLYLDMERGPYIILYMHGNSSCRIEALGLIKYLPQKISLASFDFMGCGKNEELDTISLGYRQAEQTSTVVQYLKDKGFKVMLWGRSMGAATALLYGKAELIVADSSFKSFRSLCKQVAKCHGPKIVPNCLINCFFPCFFYKLKKDVNKRADYDVDQLDVREAVKKLDPKTVIVFMSGDKDLLINSRNSQKMYDLCSCQDKHIRIFEGDHNTRRPQSVLIEVMGIIRKHVNKKQAIDPQIGMDGIILKFDE